DHDAIRIHDAQERGSGMSDELEEVPFAPELVGVTDALADVGTCQHEAQHALAVLYGRQRPGNVDRAAAGSAEAMLLLAGDVRDHTVAKLGGIFWRGEDLP